MKNFLITIGVNLVLIVATGYAFLLSYDYLLASIQ